MSEAALAGGEWVPEDSFGLRLYALRKARDWTQKEAAEICGVDDGSWSNWENGSRPRRMDEVVAKISANTGVSRGWLMWGNPVIRWSSDGGWLTSMNYGSENPDQLPLDFESIERRAAFELVASP